MSASPSQQILQTFSSVSVYLLTQSLLLIVVVSNCARISLLQPMVMSVPAKYLLRAVTHLQFRLCLSVCEQQSIQINVSVDGASNLRILRYPHKFGGTPWRSWLSPCASSRKVPGLIPDCVIVVFHGHNPSGCTVALEPTQPVTEMGTSYIFWGEGVKAAGA